MVQEPNWQIGYGIIDLHLHVSVQSVCITTSIVGILILGSGMPHGVLNEVQYNFVKPPPSVQPDFGVITSLAIN